MLLLIILAILAALSYLTNPFTRLSIIRRPFVVEAAAETLHTIKESHKLTVRQGRLWRTFAVMMCGFHILETRYLNSPRARGYTASGIAMSIHELRFDPKKLLVVSGDHFSALFVRNLGVFYYPLLDDRIPGSDTDWRNRQTVYLQTVAYALGVFAKHPVPATTIVPTGSYRATCVNFYAYPSDTVYGILYALASLLGEQNGGYAGGAKKQHALRTQVAAGILQVQYRDTLCQLYDHYRTTVFDEAAGLVRKDIHLSGAKDITKRSSAFYDNVVFWKTTQLAGLLGLITPDERFLEKLKARILETFWLETDGHFLEDLSDEGVEQRYYSSDWLIVLSAGFLSPLVKAERHYFERSFQYIQKHGIDQPFALKYQHETRAGRQFLPVRLAVASYGGDAIWSFWGMEYIKTLLLLHKQTGGRSYLREADFQIAAYEKNMVRDGGFPEVYDRKGKMLVTPFYKSIRQTGWVIGFEQVQVMRKEVAL
ncbi:MAG TPA: hypothetical protein VMR98_04225 [Candidatus Polarisedimenticolaceae bacterium]|nr:hypothetical protein [Candidatus Polarisedimenticolaceae bacterium]